jgi:hypothetical protein
VDANSKRWRGGMDAATRRAMVGIVGDEKEMFPSKSTLGRWRLKILLSKPRSIEDLVCAVGKCNGELRMDGAWMLLLMSEVNTETPGASSTFSAVCARSTKPPPQRTNTLHETINMAGHDIRYQNGNLFMELHRREHCRRPLLVNQ